MVHSQNRKKSASANVFLYNFEAFEGVTSSKIARSESVFSSLACFILFGVFEKLCKSEGRG